MKIMLFLCMFLRNLKSALRKWRNVCILGVFSCIIIWLTFSKETEVLRAQVNSYISSPCQDEDALNVIDTICTLHRNGQIVGDLCLPLCQQGLVQFQSCLHNKRDKHVMLASCTNLCLPGDTVPTVLKMSHSNLSDLQQFQNIDETLRNSMRIQDEVSLDIKKFEITARSLSLLVQEQLENEYGFTPRDGQDMLSMLWNEGYGDYFKKDVTNMLFVRSFWSVFRQDEYRISKVFGDWNVFPKIYHSCGPLYLSENAPGWTSFSSIFSILGFGKFSWSSRAKLAIDILYLVQRMENMEHPLHLCDVKSPHFGVVPNQGVKFIDADMVFTDKTMSSFFSESHCQKHEDCHFFDCEGGCDVNSSKCAPARLNNNLQIVCAKIFRSFYPGLRGLLFSPPYSIATKLSELVDRCADEITEVQEQVKVRKPDLGLLLQLTELLAGSLKG